MGCTTRSSSGAGGSISKRMLKYWFFFLIVVSFVVGLSSVVAAEEGGGDDDEGGGGCLSNQELNDFFEFNPDTGRSQSIPKFKSCCMEDVCGLTCPRELSKPASGFGTSVTISIIISFLIGALTYFLIHGSAENFFVAGRSLPLSVLCMTLASQAIDSNAILGNVDFSYKYSFWDGAVIPLGLGLSLLLNGIFLADKVNTDGVLTLPDILAKRYGKLVEILASISTLVSFMMLLAGNLVGMGIVIGYLWDTTESAGIWLSSSIIWAYTVCGGLFSVAYTDVIQGTVGWVGCLITAYYLIANAVSTDNFIDPLSSSNFTITNMTSTSATTNNNNILFAAPPPSIGFPGYIYPDNIGDGGICDMYQGIPCSVNASQCCYNDVLWCPNLNNNNNNDFNYCNRYDRGAYPIGDQPVYDGQMTNPYSLTPFPNAILFNWATILILAFGNLAALDFQARCMAAKSPKSASLGCIIGGCLTLFVGIPFSFLGSITRASYGPDSIHSVFEADTCSVALGLPTCAKWVPDPVPFLKLLTHDVPPILGGWCIIGIVAATLSTADGAILALGTVMANNLFRHLDYFWPDLVTPDNLLFFARVSTLPLTLVSTTIAAYYRSNANHAAGATGSLLIIAFDVTFATVVVPLFGAFYAKKPSPRAALLSVLSGGITRLVLELTLPKDGSLLLPFTGDEFQDYGPGASTYPPSFIDINETKWDPELDQCQQAQLSDYTGIDSLASIFISLVLFCSIQYIEHKINRPLFHFPGGTGYEKKTVEEGIENNTHSWVYPLTVVFATLGVVFLIFTVLIVTLKNKFLY